MSLYYRRPLSRRLAAGPSPMVRRPPSPRLLLAPSPRRRPWPDGAPTRRSSRPSIPRRRARLACPSSPRARPRCAHPSFSCPAAQGPVCRPPLGPWQTPWPHRYPCPDRVETLSALPDRMLLFSGSVWAGYRPNFLRRLMATTMHQSISKTCAIHYCNSNTCFYNDIINPH